MSHSTLFIPLGQLSASTDDAAARAQRKRIAEMLRKGETVSISSDGVLHEPGQGANPASTADGQRPVVPGEVELIVPSGKLA